MIPADVESGEPPPDYPECPKYPEAVFSGAGRQESGDEIHVSDRSQQSSSTRL